ncbi:hypothetical protein LG3211_5183 [Lysobacter gummosus]|nr:hypothetical protein LG3211_5183 [Lysobacter gummosus]
MSDDGHRGSPIRGGASAGRHLGQASRPAQAVGSRFLTFPPRTGSS